MNERGDPAAGQVVERPWHRSYEPGVPPNVPVPDRPLHGYLSETAARYPRRQAIRFFGRALTYRELDEAVNRFANALVSLGVRPGDRVALLLPNCPQFVIAYYGGLRAGAVMVPMNPTHTEPEIQHQLADAGARAVASLSLLYPRVQAVREALPELEHVIVTNIKEYLPALSQVLFTVARERREGHHVDVVEDGRTHWWQPLLDAASPADPGIPVEPSALAALQYTAGTTGIPKGVMHTHQSLGIGAFHAQAWLVNVHEPGAGDVVLGVIPLFHTYAQTTVMNYPIFTGGTMVLQPRFVLKDVVRALESERPDFFPGVPALYAAIAGAPERGRHTTRHSLKACISGAAPLAPEVQARFEALTGAKLVEGYGLTEAPVTHCNPIVGERRAGTIGIPIPNTDAIILDLETGTRVLGPGEAGELAVRGPQVMQGYWRRPEETAQVFKEGWLLTGDIGRMDEDGYVRLVDRKKEIIITGGLNVFPSEVERVLSEHPSVEEVVVVGVPDARRGEVVKAFVVPREGASASEQELIAFCRARLAGYKVPRAVEFRQELPKSLIGKVLRRMLVEEERARHPQGESFGDADEV